MIGLGPLISEPPAPWWCPITPADLEALRLGAGDLRAIQPGPEDLAGLALGAGEIGAIQAPFSAPDQPDQKRITTKTPSGKAGSVRINSGLLKNKGTD
jgi:hypothetical protein